MSDAPRLPKPRLPRIRGTQIGLRDPSMLDQIKKDMLAGTFVYHESRARIAGFVDGTGTYYVSEGHHRMLSALEIFRETGDDTWVRQLIYWGLWTEVLGPPSGSRPMPSRHFWGSLRNWFGY